MAHPAVLGRAHRTSNGGPPFRRQMHAESQQSCFYYDLNLNKPREFRARSDFGLLIVESINWIHTFATETLDRSLGRDHEVDNKIEGIQDRILLMPIMTGRS